MALLHRNIHGTTNLGYASIKTYGIQTRGYTQFGVMRKPSSLDFGEGFYTTLNNKLCRQQVSALAKTRAAGYANAEPCVIKIKVDPAINQDRLIKCIYFDGGRDTDGLDWAQFIVHHRVLKDRAHCKTPTCNTHPDVMIGPVADGNAITAFALDVYKGKMSVKDFYNMITVSKWFPQYKQIVFGSKASIKYLHPVL